MPKLPVKVLSLDRLNQIRQQAAISPGYPTEIEQLVAASEWAHFAVGVLKSLDNVKIPGVRQEVVKSVIGVVELQKK